MKKTRSESRVVVDTGEATIPEIREQQRQAFIVAASLVPHVQDIIQDEMSRIEDDVESPIELMFGAAMLFRWEETLLVGLHNVLSKPAFKLVPQYEITLGAKSYRADFGFEWFESGKLALAVECDGFEFHERTKEQAENDREKDRAFQDAGIPLYRFPGSMIWRDAAACAEQVGNALSRIWVAS